MVLLGQVGRLIGGMDDAVWAANDNATALTGLSTVAAQGQEDMEELYSDYLAAVEEAEAKEAERDIMNYRLPMAILIKMFSNTILPYYETVDGVKDMYDNKARELADGLATEYEPYLSLLRSGQPRVFEAVNAIAHPGAFGMPLPPGFGAGGAPPAPPPPAFGGAPPPAPAFGGAPRMAGAPPAFGGAGAAPAAPRLGSAMRSGAGLPPGFDGGGANAPGGPPGLDAAGAPAGGMPGGAPLGPGMILGGSQAGSGDAARHGQAGYPAFAGGSPSAGGAPAFGGDMGSWVPDGGATSAAGPPAGLLPGTFQPAPGMAPPGPPSTSSLPPSMPSVPPPSGRVADPPPGGAAPPTPPNSVTAPPPPTVPADPPQPSVPASPELTNTPNSLPLSEMEMPPGTMMPPGMGMPPPPSGQPGQQGNGSGEQKGRHEYTSAPSVQAHFGSTSANLAPSVFGKGSGSVRGGSNREAPRSVKPDADNATSAVLANARATKRAMTASERRRATKQERQRRQQRVEELRKSDFEADTAPSTAPVMEGRVAAGAGPAAERTANVVPAALRTPDVRAGAPVRKRGSADRSADRATRRGSTIPASTDESMPLPADPAATWEVENPGGPVVATEPARQAKHAKEPPPSLGAPG
ncbi:hypothetical protein EV191_104150 [Tamaricihabitans halophyticus]|uniref:Uncharacterized protein n=2 Tax=Tamaricihabitans halophyticus TaxID=1262583 RepID=A0A4R2QUD2_9PSEU|nr:hypothetical protein EV191_104150 [Tamaricihabitans halophyticus]